jgi:hypothetical protein
MGKGRMHFGRGLRFITIRTSLLGEGIVLFDCWSRNGQDEIVQKALALYTLKHPKQSFTFLHCWYILREHPHWMETPREQCSRQQLRRAPDSSVAPMTPTHPSAQADFAEDSSQVDSSGLATPAFVRLSGSGPTKQKWPTGGKCAKEEVKAVKQKEYMLRAQARAAADMAATSIQKAQVLQDQAALNLFTMPRADPTEVAEYLRMRQQEELAKLRERLNDVTKKARVEAAEKAKASANNAAEVADAMRQRVPPPPLSRSPSPVVANSDVEDVGDAPSPPPEVHFHPAEGAPQQECTPSPNLEFQTGEKIHHHEEDPVNTQQSAAAPNFNNWRSFGNHERGDTTRADGGKVRFRDLDSNCLFSHINLLFQRWVINDIHNSHFVS